jgi:hypothetical protein
MARRSCMQYSCTRTACSVSACAVQGVDMLCFFSPSAAEERSKIPKEERGEQCWLAVQEDEGRASKAMLLLGGGRPFHWMRMRKWP